jgi:hypothetical protein
MIWNAIRCVAEKIMLQIRLPKKYPSQIQARYPRRIYKSRQPRMKRIAALRYLPALISAMAFSISSVITRPIW